MITSFSNTNDVLNNNKRDSDTALKGNEFVPQSRFAKMLMTKSGVGKDIKNGSRSNNDGGIVVNNTDEDVPLYKRLKKSDRVLARYSADDQHYPAVVRAVMHGGYLSAQYDVVFEGFEGTVHTVSWTDIRQILPILSAADIKPQSSISDTFGQSSVVGSEKLVMSVSDFERLSRSSSMTSSSSSSSQPIESIRYDSATGMTTINDSGGGHQKVASNSTVPFTASNETSSCQTAAAEKDWTVNNQQTSVSVTAASVAASAQTSGAITTRRDIDTGPVVNAKMLQRSKGGWKNAKK
eukprot:gene30128-37292_t